MSEFMMTKEMWEVQQQMLYEIKSHLIVIENKLERKSDKSDCEDKHRALLNSLLIKNYSDRKLNKYITDNVEDTPDEKKDIWIIRAMNKLFGKYTDAVKWTILLLILSALMAYLHISNQNKINLLEQKIAPIIMMNK